MSLRTLIESIDQWEAMTAAELHAELAAMTKTVTDDALYTWAGVALLIGPQNAEGLRLALEGNGLGWAVHQLGGSGIQLSHASAQALLTALAAVPGANVLKSQGIHTEPVTNATVEDVKAVLLEIRKEGLVAAGATRWNAYVAAVDAWDGTGIEPTL